MQITAKTWNEYITRLSRLNQKAGQLMRQYIDTHGTGDADALITYAAALVTKYGEGSAELACQMYDALAEAANAGVPAAEPAEPADYGEVARMVNATKNQNPANLPNGVSRLVKRAGADTTLKNAVRDGAEWAWVPHGDTCPFCITLASNGWQKASSKVLKGGHADHIHANCDCEFAIRFDHNTTVAGYDPEKYLAQYNAAGGDINKMRRVNYAANKERINAQKRAAYAARKGYTNQAASAILDTSNKIGVNQDVNFVCKIDRSLYRIVEQDLVTDEVIITEQQILHIEEGHPGDYNRLAAYIPDVLQQPDYILRGNRPHTALVLKQISTPEMTAEVVLRLKVSGDPEEYKNSIITMWNISQKRFRRLLRQSEILYKKE
uniref:VG15 protein n=1 Tax=Gemmiger qucibialis TaxID=2997294 RepID=UPI00402917A1